MLADIKRNKECRLCPYWLKQEAESGECRGASPTVLVHEGKLVTVFPTTTSTTYCFKNPFVGPKQIGGTAQGGAQKMTPPPAGQKPPFAPPIVESGVAP